MVPECVGGFGWTRVLQSCIVMFMVLCGCGVLGWSLDDFAQTQTKKLISQNRVSSMAEANAVQLCWALKERTSLRLWGEG